MAMALMKREPLPRLQEQYEAQILSALAKNIGRPNRLSLPKLVKISINMGVGKAVQEKERIKQAAEHLALISGQRPQITKARMAVSGFRLREGNEIGCRVTLRGKRMYEFLDRLINLALPRIRDFRGVNPKSFDGNGNYSMGLTEQLVFPEIDPDKVSFTQGMDITIVTSTSNDDEARLLLRAFGMPFREEDLPVATLRTAAQSRSSEKSDFGHEHVPSPSVPPKHHRPTDLEKRDDHLDRIDEEAVRYEAGITRITAAAARRLITHTQAVFWLNNLADRADDSLHEALASPKCLDRQLVRLEVIRNRARKVAHDHRHALTSETPGQSAVTTHPIRKDTSMESDIPSNRVRPVHALISGLSPGNAMAVGHVYRTTILIEAPSATSSEKLGTKLVSDDPHPIQIILTGSAFHVEPTSCHGGLHPTQSISFDFSVTATESGMHILTVIVSSQVNFQVIKIADLRIEAEVASPALTPV